MQQAIVMGVGAQQGLGAELCRYFAKRGLAVHVVGRTLPKLESVVSDIESAGGTATAHVVDCREEDAQSALFESVSALGRIDLAIYNAGNAFPGSLSDITPTYFRDAWEVCCFGGFLFAQNATRHMQPHKQGTLLFTGASASLRGRANFSAFNSSKAALRTLAQAVSKEYGPAGIHVAHVIIDGAINGNMVKSRWPKTAEKLGDAGMLSLQGIAAAYGYLYDQPATAWSFELDLRTACEPW